MPTMLSQQEPSREALYAEVKSLLIAGAKTFPRSADIVLGLEALCAGTAQTLPFAIQKAKEVLKQLESVRDSEYLPHHATVVRGAFVLFSLKLLGHEELLHSTSEACPNQLRVSMQQLRRTRQGLEEYFPRGVPDQVVLRLHSGFKPVVEERQSAQDLFAEYAFLYRIDGNCQISQILSGRHPREEGTIKCQGAALVSLPLAHGVKNVLILGEDRVAAGSLVAHLLDVEVNGRLIHSGSSPEPLSLSIRAQDSSILASNEVFLKVADKELKGRPGPVNQIEFMASMAQHIGRMTDQEYQKLLRRMPPAKAVAAGSPHWHNIECIWLLSTRKKVRCRVEMLPTNRYDTFGPQLFEALRRSSQLTTRFIEETFTEGRLINFTGFQAQKVILASHSAENDRFYRQAAGNLLGRAELSAYPIRMSYGNQEIIVEPDQPYHEQLRGLFTAIKRSRS